MAITATTLTADLAAGALTMTVTSGTGFPAVGSTANPGYRVKINGEYMRAVSQPVAGTIKLTRRGDNGSASVAHDVLSRVEVSSDPADFAPTQAGQVIADDHSLPVRVTIGENITFTAADVAAWGMRPRQFTFTKATAATAVLGAPSKAQDGLVLTFTSSIAVLNIVSTTSLLANGDTASPYNTATGTNTKIGASITLQAENGLWNVIANLFNTIA